MTTRPDPIAVGAQATQRRAVAAVVVLDLRLVRVGAVILVLLMGAITAVVVLQYAVTFADQQAAQGLQMLAQNPAIRVLFGVPRALDSAGGFTVWRIGTFAAVAAAVWGLLAATRLARGEEDAGRTALLLAGPLTLARLQAQRLLLLLTVQVVLGATVYLALSGTGAGGAGAAAYGLGIALAGMFYTAVGCLCGQLSGDRHTATEMAMVAFGGGLLLRMLGDGRDDLAWLLWLSPFGLLSLSAPYADNRLFPLLVLFVAVLACAVVALALSAGRDVGDGVIAARRVRSRSTLLLRSVTGFAIRRSLPGLRGWGIGLGAYYGLIGALSVSLTDFLAANPRFAEIAASAGFAQLTTEQGYLAALFFLLPVPLGLFGVTELAADAADEERGRLTVILSHPIARHRWTLTRLGAITIACCGLAVSTGICAFIGARAAGASVTLGQAVAGGANALPAAMLAVGAAQLALGLVPRAVVPLGAVPVVGGFVLWIFAGSFGWPVWVANLSPFDHVASVPATPPDAAGAWGMLAVAVVFTVVGTVGFARRDLHS